VGGGLDGAAMAWVATARPRDKGDTAL